MVPNGATGHGEGNHFGVGDCHRRRHHEVDTRCNQLAVLGENSCAERAARLLGDISLGEVNCECHLRFRCPRYQIIGDDVLPPFRKDNRCCQRMSHLPRSSLMELARLGPILPS